MTDRKYWFWINNIPGIGNIRVRRLLKAFGDNPEEVYNAGTAELLSVEGIKPSDTERIADKKLREEIFRKYEEFLSGSMRCVFPCDEDYPDRLLELYDRPNVLYYLGKLPDAGKKAVAIVGSRNCSEYGRAVAGELGRLMAANGVEVISGMALGIDKEAHRGAVYAGGNTYAVLAGGADICYPKQNFNIYCDILNKGGVISEFPAGTPTNPGMFPLRNRIISGLADSVIVVEAGEHSGSLITVAQALEQNRQVYAVPGRIGDPDSLGCNRLIAQGAQIVAGYEDILQEMEIYASETNKKLNITLAQDEKLLYTQLLNFAPRSLDSLVRETGIGPDKVLTAVLGLELKGLIRETGQNFYVRIM
ncbi:MAG: DNA-processing protein DprA [Butyrivibrio sp.]